MRGRGRALALLLSVAMMAALLPATVVVAQQAQSIDRICPPPDGENRSFNDTDGHLHQASIECAAGYELVQGFPDGTFRPGVRITRGQMATFTRNFIETATARSMPAGQRQFTDTQGNQHESAINALAAAGVIQGRQGGQFQPNSPVRRDQMATFIANAIDYAYDGQVNGNTPPPSATRTFDDIDNNVHRSNIERLAAVGVVVGRAARTYDPALLVPRGQMATFVMRGGGYLDTEEAWAPTLDPVAFENLRLAGANVVDNDGNTNRGEPNAAANATIVIDRSTRSLSFEVDYRQVSGPFGNADGLVIRRGTPDVNGPVVVTLATGSQLDAESDKIIEGEVSEDDAQITFRELVADPAGFYVVIHSNAYANHGAVRAQLSGGLPRVSADLVALTSRPPRPAPGVTSAPELEGVTVTQSTPLEQRARLTLSFTRAISPSITGSSIALYEPNTARRLAGNAAGVTVSRGADGSSVVMDINFAANPTYSLADLGRFSVLAVEPGTVRGTTTSALQNPPGSVPLFQVTYPDGRTDLPDLIGVGGYRDSGSNVIVHFRYDEALPAGAVTSAAGFRLILSNGSVVRSTAAEVSATDATLLNVTFPRPSGVADAAALRNAARRAGNVPDAITVGGTKLPRRVIALADDGSTSGLDLLNVTLNAENNTAIFTFDTNLNSSSSAITPAGFHLVHMDGTTTPGSSASVSNNAATVAFPAGTVTYTVVGATVAADSVATAPLLPLPGTVLPSTPNEDDGVGYHRVFPAGRTVVAGLNSVSVEDGFAANDKIVTYAFDRRVGGFTTSGFRVTNDLGVQFIASSCSRAGARNVVCVFNNVQRQVAHVGFTSLGLTQGTFIGNLSTHADGIAVRP